MALGAELRCQLEGLVRERDAAQAGVPKIAATHRGGELRQCCLRAARGVQLARSPLHPAKHLQGQEELMLSDHRDGI